MSNANVLTSYAVELSSISTKLQTMVPAMMKLESENDRLRKLVDGKYSKILSEERVEKLSQKLHYVTRGGTTAPAKYIKEIILKHLTDGKRSS